jgi:hypothetical protein
VSAFIARPEFISRGGAAPAVLARDLRQNVGH